MRLADRIIGATVDRFVEAPAQATASLVMVIAIGTIVSNALFLQTGRHPAPLLPTRAAEVQETAPAPSVNPAEEAPAPHAASRPQAQAEHPMPEMAALPRRQPEIVPASSVETLAPIDRYLVRDIQQALAGRGLYTGTVDGLYGPMTAAAIRSYQTEAGLATTGTASAGLLARLQLGVSGGATPAATASVPAPATARNHNDSIVKAVQFVLTDLGYGQITTDGKIGEETRSAIRRFQLDRGLDISGEIDSRLLAELETVLGRTVF